MVLGMKPYRIYKDENGHRWSCRVRGCSDGDGSWEQRAKATEEAKAHFEGKHAADPEHEAWITNISEAGPIRVPEGGTQIQ
jgi:hypothetical protein